MNMKIKNVFSFLALTAMASQTLVYPVYAQPIIENYANQEIEMINEDILPTNGLMSYYFTDEHFKDLELMAPIKNGDFTFKGNEVDKLLTKDKSIKSIRWTGRIIPSEDGIYTLSTDRDDVLMQINSKDDIAKTLSINMKKGQEYTIRIEVQGENLGSIDTMSAPKLYWELNGNKTIIPEENLFLRDYSKIDENDPFIPNNNFFDLQFRSSFGDEDLDTDNDNIPDSYEINGYTIKDSIAIKWDDSLAEQGYKKYVSSYLQSNTAGDPYTDYEKASGSFDKAIKAEARDPLVAAYPIVGVGMEKLIISTNEHASTDQGKTVSRATTNSKTDSNTGGVSVSAGYQNGFTGSITTNYSHTTENSTSVQDSNGESWNTGLSINKGESAYINANVRYYNTGTAPMYKVTPTTNLVLDGDTLTTIKAQDNQIGNNLSPNETYPKKGLSPLALNTMDQFSSKLIPINYDQLKKLDAGKQIKLETTQVSGNFGTKNNQGQIVTEGNSWSDYISQIDSISASLILDTGNETFERRVAAKDSSNPEDKTPELTIGEAIEKAFGATKNGGLLYFNEIPIDESCVELIFDDNTANIIKNSLKTLDDKKIYNVKLERGMNILIKTPSYFTNFDGHNTFPKSWSNINTQNKDGLQGTANEVNGETKITLPMSNLKPYKRYIFSGYSKSSSASNSLNINIKAKEQKTDQFVLDNGYKKFSYEFETTGKDSPNIEITLTSNDKIFLDNLSITELNSTPEILKEPEIKVPSDQEILAAHNKYYADIKLDTNTGNTYIDGIYFEPTQTNKEALDYIQKYRVEATLQYSGFKDIGTKDKEVRNYLGDPNQPKTNYINLRSYFTSGENVMTYKKLRIYAVTPDNRELLVLSVN
ncbi:iota toxin protein Ib (plasmid) [Clostridium perfringens]|uniref:Iota toxin component Ib n=2 Tax=Clostridium perfringens TaxID=1502 RepID=F7J0A3_CLOPF|nr:binary toxin-like calcium binding domain-containing protein [Clostridium perfringens]UBL00756.1 iota toxin protein Ib [Clostridium perfringens]BAK40944.1 iota toxin component Ib [Clostridium perfringens]